ncbi:MAG: hypothetical protein IPJ76_18450 [Flavobacteriales bacterium]|nr:MAG: hypothetical protein IPJ76_18450 [Flavobacteriales bacterium]
MGAEHLGFIGYFKQRRFGSEPPVMSLLSLLPPKDRCEILEDVRAYDPANINVFDKLSMAYMKSNRMELGLNLIAQGLAGGHLSYDNGQILRQKLESMQANHRGSFGSAQNYGDCQALLASHVQQMRTNGTYAQLKDFCDVMETYLISRTQTGPATGSGGAIPEWFARFNQEFFSAGSLEALGEVRGRYTAVAHPYVHFSLGSRYLYLGKLDNAFYHLLQASSIGVRNKRAYWDTLFADSVGSSIAQLFSRELIARIPRDLNTFHLFISGYMFLSSSIGLYGNKAYESLANRARMIMSCQHGADITAFLTYGGLREVLAISDHYRSSLGYAEQGMMDFAVNQKENAGTIHQWLEDISVSGRDANDYQTEELVAIGQQRHDAIVNKIKPEFFDGFPVGFPVG